MTEEKQNNNNEQVIYESSAGNYDEHISNTGADAESGTINNNDATIGYFVKNGNITEAFSEYEIMSNNLMEPINPLDPKVYHDPPYVQPFVAKLKNKTSAAAACLDAAAGLAPCAAYPERAAAWLRLPLPQALALSLPQAPFLSQARPLQARLS